MFRLPSVLALLLLGALPASAAAATVTTDRACYQPGDPVAVKLAGFTPGGDPLDVRVNDDVAAEATIDAGGGASVTAKAVRGAPPQPVAVRVQDSLTILAETTFRVSVPVVEMSPTRAKPTSRVTYTATGFDTTGTVYLHVVRGGRALRTVKLGRPATACAPVVARIPQVPLGGRVAKGRYRLQFDTAASYRASTRPAVVRTRAVG